MSTVKVIVKVFLWLLVSVLAFIIVLLAVAKISENKITELVLNKVSQTIKAPVKINNVSFTLLRKFPLATIELNGFLLGTCTGTDSLAAKNDTIASFDKLYLSVKTRPLINGQIDIIKIELAQTNVNYFVDTAGKTNIDFLFDAMPPADTTIVEQPDTTPSSLFVNLQLLELNNVTCNYTDNASQIKATVTIPNILVNAKVIGQNYNANVNGSVELTNCAVPGVNLHLMQKTGIAFNVDVINDSINIKKLKIETDGAMLAMKGNFLLDSIISGNFNIDANKIDLAELVKYAPADMLSEFGVKKVGGVLSFNANINGPLTDTVILPYVNADIAFNNGLVQTTEYPELHNISFKGNVTNGALQNNSTTAAVFDYFKLETGKTKLNLKFAVSNIDKPKFSANAGVNLFLPDFRAFVPDSLVKYFDGTVNLKLATSGVMPDSIDDKFIEHMLDITTAQVNFINVNANVDSSLQIKSLCGKVSYRNRNLNVDKLKVSVPAYGFTLKNLTVDAAMLGQLNNNKTLGADIKKLVLETDSSEINGSVYVQNIDNPNYKIISTLKINLAEFSHLVPDTLVKTMNGIVNFNMQSAGSVNPDSIEQQMYTLLFEQSKFGLGLSNINIKMADTLLAVSNFSGNIKLNNDTLTINSFGGNVSGIDFLIDSTHVWNLYKAFLLHEPGAELIVQTNVNITEFDYNKIMALMPTDTTITDTTSLVLNSSANNTTAQNNTTQQTDTITEQPADTAYSALPNWRGLGLPPFMLRGKFSIGKVIYENNIIDDISMLFRFTDSIFVIDQFKLTTCEGKVNTSLKLDARKPELYVIDIKNSIENLDINKLLVVNDNFVAYTGDTLISHQNLSGTLTSSIDARAFYVNGQVPTERIRAQGSFTLKNGRLYDFKPLAELSMSIGGLKELDKLDFNTLTTSLFVFKDKIFIPRTDVVTSAIDITAFAMQGIKTDYEYHLVMYMKDVLAGKSDKLMKMQAEQNKKDGEPVERNGINLVAMDKEGKTKYGIDNKNLKKSFENELNKQQGFLKFAFNPLLVNYSTDYDRTDRNKEILKEQKNN